jgi:hypothetical protein
MTSSLPTHNQRFNMRFDNGNIARAVRIAGERQTGAALRALGFMHYSPVIFVSGGAGGMSEEDKAIATRMIEEVCRYAVECNAVIVDGGTESGIMQMLGDVRRRFDLGFPLIGVSPLGKISYPGYKNSNEEAFLEDSHSHFVLVDGEEWGDESKTIVGLTNQLSGYGRRPAIGLLINGGAIALKEIYLATNTQRKMSIIVLEGSGRAADDISTAVRKGNSNQALLQAILKGGDIELVGTADGPEAIRAKLQEKFK